MPLLHFNEKSSTVSSQIIELHQFCNDRFFLPLADPFGNAGLQVLFQDQRFKLFNGLAHCIRLAQNVNAVLVLFDHLANTTNVSLDVVEPLEYILLVSAHLSSPLASPLPAGYGGSLPQIWHPCKCSRPT